jgi:hypothetical protein
MRSEHGQRHGAHRRAWLRARAGVGVGARLLPTRARRRFCCSRLCLLQSRAWCVAHVDVVGGTHTHTHTCRRRRDFLGYYKALGIDLEEAAGDDEHTVRPCAEHTQHIDAAQHASCTACWAAPMCCVC